MKPNVEDTFKANHVLELFCLSATHDCDRETPRRAELFQTSSPPWVQRYLCRRGGNLDQGPIEIKKEKNRFSIQDRLPESLLVQTEKDRPARVFP
jgi:hypothetical protein